MSSPSAKSIIWTFHTGSTLSYLHGRFHLEFVLPLEKIMVIFSTGGVWISMGIAFFFKSSPPTASPRQTILSSDKKKLNTTATIRLTLFLHSAMLKSCCEKLINASTLNWILTQSVSLYTCMNGGECLNLHFCKKNASWKVCYWNCCITTGISWLL